MRILLVAIISGIFFSISTPLVAQTDKAQVPAERTFKLQLDGKKLFRRKCNRCHSMKIFKDSTGPALGGVTERREMDWLISFTRNSAAMIQAGDSLALKVWRENDKANMDAFPDLTEGEIRAIFKFIEEESKRIKNDER